MIFFLYWSGLECKKDFWENIFREFQYTSCFRILKMVAAVRNQWFLHWRFFLLLFTSTHTLPIYQAWVYAAHFHPGHFVGGMKGHILLKLSANVSEVNSLWGGGLNTCLLLSIRSSGTANRALWEPRGPMVAGDLCWRWRLQPLWKKRKKEKGVGGGADKRRARLEQAGWWIDYMIQDLSH